MNNNVLIVVITTLCNVITNWVATRLNENLHGSSVKLV